MNQSRAKLDARSFHPRGRPNGIPRALSLAFRDSGIGSLPSADLLQGAPLVSCRFAPAATAQVALSAIGGTKAHAPTTQVADLHSTRGDMTPGTVRLHRVLRTTPEKLYRAFLTADAIAKWIPPYGFTCKVHQMDARVGGAFRMSFENFSTRSTHSFGGHYLELVPNEVIRYTDTFDDPNLPGEMQVTVRIRAVSCGAELTVVQEGIPAAIPLEMCYLGWQESLEQLRNLVEPDIPG